MKRFRLAAMLLCCVLLAGCGNEEPETVVFYDIETEEEELVFVMEGRDIVLGMQFLQGEPVMLVGRELNPYNPNNGEVVERDIYLCRTDGSRELLVQGAVGNYADSDWYVDNEQAVYHVDGAVSDKSILVKYESKGKEVYRTDLGADLADICQAADGRIYLLLQKNQNSTKWLEVLDTAAGETVRAGGDLELATDTRYLGTGPEGLFSMREFQQPVFMGVDLKEKSADTFLTSIGTSYVPKHMELSQRIGVQDFQVSEDGSVEILWKSTETGEVVLERLKEVRVEKIPVTVRALTYQGEEWLRQQTARFNSENEKYHVVLEESGVDFSGDVDAVTRKQNWEDYAKMTSVQMATGKGPDLLYGYLLQDYAAGLAEKGGFEDLAPYMERSGIREEDYYPLTFGGWRDGGKIYSVRTEASAREYLMDGAVLGTGREPGSIQELMDALLAWQGDEIFLEWTDQAGLLELFLGGTEDMWGMIDWEQGTCDFGGELFGKLLEVSRRYGDDGSGKRAPLAVTNYVSWDLFGFISSSDREEEGLVKAGVLFEDGCHAVTSDYNMKMNANSANKEGAWEFIRFLLGEEAQSVCNIGLGRSPVYKAAFPVLLELRRDRITSSGTEVVYMSKWIDGEKVNVRVEYGEEELSDEEMGEYLATLEDARALPVRTRPIIEIICEEAGGYFAGSKSIEETAEIVKNRVQVYLDEVCSPK